MAKIPLGNFGNVVPQSPGQTRVPQAAFDTVGGLQKFGDTLMRTGVALQEEQFRQADEQRRQNEALTRAKAANAVLDREVAVKTVAQGIDQDIADGKLPYDQAQGEYHIRVAALDMPAVDNLDPVTAENFSKGIKRADFNGEQAISGTIHKARVADFRTQTDTLMDKLGKGASLPGADVSKLNAQIDGLDEIGQQAYGKEWAKLKQTWRDKNWNDHVGQLVLSGANDMQALNNLEQQLQSGDLADKLDSDKRNTQMARIAGYKTVLINKAEAAANRAERERERLLKNAEAEFNTFQSLVDKGTVIDPAYVDRVTQATAGTPYQKGIVALAKQANETGGIASRPIAVQQAAIDEIDRIISTHGRTPELDKRREQLVKIRDGSRKDVREEGVRAWTARSNDVMTPIDISSPEALAQSVSERLKLAERASQWAGQAVSPLDAREAEGVRNMLDALPPKAKSQAVAQLAETVGPRAASAIAAQLDEKDKPLSLAFATAGARTTADRYTSELILKGATAIKDKAVMHDEKTVTGWKSIIAKEVDGIFPDERLTTATKEAAYYIAAGIAQEKGGNVSGSDLERAVKLAMGGGIVEHNGKRLPIPAGLDADALDQRLRSVSPADILKQAPGGKVRVAGAEMSAEDFVKTIPGQELMYAGPGRYAVIVRGRPVVNAAGHPIIVGVQ